MVQFLQLSLYKLKQQNTNNILGYQYSSMSRLWAQLYPSKGWQQKYREGFEPRSHFISRLSMNRPGECRPSPPDGHFYK